MKWPKFDKFNLEERTILLGRMGSHSHGTYIPPADGGIDDIDVMGICVPPKEYYYGLQDFEQVDTWVDEYDIVIYEVRKVIRLLLKNNPNVLGLLWLRPEDYIEISPHGQLLIDNRDIFSSKLAFHSFTGYARGQLKRMTHHACKGYMGAKRKALVEKFGYDTKNAAHLIRLLRMGIEFIETGQLNVFRTRDADELKAIKRGEYMLFQLHIMADELFKRAEEVIKTSTLPDRPDKDKVEELLMEIVRAYLPA